MFSCIQLFATPQIVVHQAPLFMEFSRQKHLSGLPFPSLGYLSHPGIKPTSPESSALAGGFFATNRYTQNTKRTWKSYKSLCAKWQHIKIESNIFLSWQKRGFSGGSVVKEFICNAGDMGLILGSRGSPGEGNGNPLQGSCLGNSTDRRV